MNKSNTCTFPTPAESPDSLNGLADFFRDFFGYEKPLDPSDPLVCITGITNAHLVPFGVAETATTKVSYHRFEDLTFRIRNMCGKLCTIEVLRSLVELNMFTKYIESGLIASFLYPVNQPASLLLSSPSNIENIMHRHFVENEPLTLQLLKLLSINDKFISPDDGDLAAAARAVRATTPIDEISFRDPDDGMWWEIKSVRDNTEDGLIISLFALNRSSMPEGSVSDVLAKSIHAGLSAGVGVLSDVGRYTAKAAVTMQTPANRIIDDAISIRDDRSLSDEDVIIKAQSIANFAATIAGSIAPLINMFSKVKSVSRTVPFDGKSASLPLPICLRAFKKIKKAFLMTGQPFYMNSLIEASCQVIAPKRIVEGFMNTTMALIMDAVTAGEIVFEDNDEVDMSRKLGTLDIHSYHTEDGGFAIAIGFFSSRRPELAGDLQLVEMLSYFTNRMIELEYMDLLTFNMIKNTNFGIKISAVKMTSMKDLPPGFCRGEVVIHFDHTQILTL